MSSFTVCGPYAYVVSITTIFSLSEMVFIILATIGISFALQFVRSLLIHVFSLPTSCVHLVTDNSDSTNVVLHETGMLSFVGVCLSDASTILFYVKNAAMHDCTV